VPFMDDSQQRLAKAEWYANLSSVAFGGPALPSLVRYRSEAPPGRISATSEHRPFRSEEKQQDSKSLSIGSAFTGDTDMTIWRKRPCVDRIFRIIHLLRGKSVRV
jgi:hypothetical protein